MWAAGGLGTVRKAAELEVVRLRLGLGLMGVGACLTGARLACVLGSVTLLCRTVPQEKGVKFVIEPHLRFVGKPGEQVGSQAVG